MSDYPDTPITREEQYLAAGLDGGELPDPITREEQYLYEIATKIQGGAGPSVTVEPLTVTQNGTTTAPSGKAYSPVTTNVPNSYGASDEGKVVSNGALVAQTAHAPVTANGTIDTTLNNSVRVNLPNTYTVTTIEGTVAEPFGDENYSKLIADLENGKVAIFAKPRFSTPTGGFLTASYWNDNVGLVLTDLQTFYPVEARYVFESLIGVCLQYDMDGELAMGFECDSATVTLLSGSEALQLYIIRLSTGLWD